MTRPEARRKNRWKQLREAFKVNRGGGRVGGGRKVFLTIFVGNDSKNDTITVFKPEKSTYFQKFCLRYDFIIFKFDIWPFFIWAVQINSCFPIFHPKYVEKGGGGYNTQETFRLLSSRHVYLAMLR
jgi:hypothetical protein